MTNDEKSLTKLGLTQLNNTMAKCLVDKGNDMPIGVMQIYNKEGVFSEDDKAMLISFSEYVASILF
jgi:hypothetical protein